MRRAPKNIALKISTLIVLTACFAVMGSGLLVSQNLKNILTLWGEDVQLTVYLDPEISEGGRTFVENKLRDTGKIGAIRFITQERALEDFSAQLASYAPDISKDTELLRLIPASLQVRLAADVPISEQMNTLRFLAGQVRGLEGVDDVSFGQEWIDKYAVLVKSTEMIFQLLGLIILGAALFVISNAIRASIQSRKDEIVVLEMIGATSSMIRKPFMIEGAFLGFTASALAMAICFSVYFVLKQLLASKLSFLQLGAHLQFISPILIVLLVVGGALLGALASYICVRRLNDGYAGLQG